MQGQTQRHASVDRLREAAAAVAATAQDQQGHDGSGRLSCRLAQQQPCGWLEKLAGCRCRRSSRERSVDRPPRGAGSAGCCLEVRVGGLVRPSGSHADVPCLKLRTRLGKALVKSRGQKQRRDGQNFSRSSTRRQHGKRGAAGRHNETISTDHGRRALQVTLPACMLLQDGQEA